MRRGLIKYILLLTLFWSCSLAAGASAANNAAELLVDWFRSQAFPLHTEADLDPLLTKTDGKRLVLLGDSSHGTYDFYRVRAHISQRLLREQGFSFVAVEAPWEEALVVDRYVRNLPGAAATAAEALQSFSLWPDWVWNNREMERFVSWLRQYNRQLPPSQRISFVGIDLYGMLSVLPRVTGGEAARAARSALLQCLDPYRENLLHYAVAVQEGTVDCSGPVIAMKRSLLDSHPSLSFAARQRMRIIENAEAYYRLMASSDSDAWNRRDTHFAVTLESLLRHLGPQSKGIVWAHNTHVGDARQTALAEHGMQSLGQLLRQGPLADTVLLVGTAGYQGTVLASRQWHGAVESLEVPPAVADSFDELLHRTGLETAYWLFEPSDREFGPLAERRGQRAIGVVYEPEFDARDNYLATLLPARYDALIFVGETSALEPASP